MTPQSRGANNDPKSYLQRIENLLGEMETLRIDHQERCKEIRVDIKSIYDEAENAGIAVKPLKALVKYRALERAQDKLPEALDVDERTIYENLVTTLGDLGRAAAERAGYQSTEAQPFA